MNSDQLVGLACLIFLAAIGLTVRLLLVELTGPRR